MAYLNLQTGAPPVGGGQPSLASREIAVLHLARRDPLASLRAPSGLARVARRLIGGTRPGPLACPRLEALRRHAVLLRHHGAVSADEIVRLKAMGFDAGAIAAARATILARWRPVPVRRLAVRLTLAADQIRRLGAAWCDGGVAGLAALLAAPLLRRLIAVG